MYSSIISLFQKYLKHTYRIVLVIPSQCLIKTQNMLSEVESYALAKKFVSQFVFCSKIVFYINLFGLKCYANKIVPSITKWI